MISSILKRVWLYIMIVICLFDVWHEWFVEVTHTLLFKGTQALFIWASWSTYMYTRVSIILFPWFFFISNCRFPYAGWGKGLTKCFRLNNEWLIWSTIRSRNEDEIYKVAEGVCSSVSACHPKTYIQWVKLPSLVPWTIVFKKYFFYRTERG